MSNRRIRLLRFGVFEMDLDARELRRRGQLVPLAPQPFAVLAELVSAEGRVVTRDALRARLWGDGVHVDHERGLNHCLNRIRRVLGDDARFPRFVETVPRQGYRFLANVQLVEAAVGVIAAPPRGAAVRLAPWLASLMVLALAAQEGGSGRARGGPLDRVSTPGARAAFVEGSRLLDQGPSGWRRSVEHFREAVREDPEFALAHYGLADAYLRLGEHGVLPADEAFPAAREAAAAALAIEESAPALVILATVRLNYDWDWEGAETVYRRALALDPDLIAARLGYTHLLSAAGRHDEAVRLVAEAERRHPGCSVTVRDAALVNYRARRYDEAARRFRDWAGLEPGRPDPHHWLALLHHFRGEDQSAVGEGRAVMAIAKAHPDYVARFEALPPGPAMRFYIRGSIRYLEGLRSREWVTGDDFARLRVLLGEREEALRDLERAADERSPRLLAYLRDPAFDPLRTEARFMALQRRVRARI